MQVTLPPLEKIVWSKTGNKNFIKQILADEVSLEFIIVRNTQSYIVLESNKSKYCITCNTNNIAEDCDYVLLSNKKPTLQKLEARELVFKRWLKHPNLFENTIEEIKSSWRLDVLI